MIGLFMAPGLFLALPAGFSGWRVPFAVASVYCALAALAVFTLYRAPNDLTAIVAGRIRGLLPREWRLIVCAGIAWGAFNAGYVVYLSFGPSMLEVQGMGTLAAASVISIGSWLMILSGAACGQIADRFGRRETILAVCMTGAIVALMLLGLPGAGLAASLIFGLVGMAPAGVIMALAGQAVASERRAMGIGVFFTIYYVIMTMVPPVAGWIVDKTGTPNGAILFGAGFFVLVVLAAGLFRSLDAVTRTGQVQECGFPAPLAAGDEPPANLIPGRRSRCRVRSI